jgi:glycolate oxidase FAD binding subunit
MAKALGSHGDVAAAAHDPSGPGLTGLRLEGFEASVAARCRFLHGLLAEFAPVGIMSEADADEFWNQFRAPTRLGIGRPLWRVVLPPSRCAVTLSRLNGDWLMDWGGGLIWLASTAEPTAIRSTVETAGGHAMLVRASETMRATVPALHPRPRDVCLLESRIRGAFDPRRVFETSRFLDTTHAN